MRNTLTVLALLAALAVVPACGSSTPSSPTTPPNQTPAVSACGAVNAQRIGSLSILNGTDCQSGTSPVVQFRTTSADDPTLQYICTGTVIASNAVLTARHCVENMKNVTIQWGTTTVINTSSYQFAPPGIDIAVVFSTSQAFPQTPVPLLVSRNPQQGETAVVAGFGQTQTGTGAGTVLRAGTTTISAVTTDTITTQYTGTSSGSGVCYGDSGGPLLVSQSGAWALAGVTSYLSGGNACTATSNNFMNLKNPALQSFISGIPGLPAGK